MVLQGLHGKQHFTTYHGKLGLVASVCALLTTAVGAVAFRKFGVLQSVPLHWQDRVKLLHRLSGPAVMAMAVANSFIGYGTVAAGPRVMLHAVQRLSLIALALAEAFLLWGDRAARKLGWTAAEKIV